jgi:hypothetical protein
MYKKKVKSKPITKYPKIAKGLIDVFLESTVRKYICTTYNISNGFTKEYQRPSLQKLGFQKHNDSSLYFAPKGMVSILKIFGNLVFKYLTSYLQIFQ